MEYLAFISLIYLAVVVAVRILAACVSLCREYFAVMCAYYGLGAYGRSRYTNILGAIFIQSLRHEKYFR